ncbi:MAG: envelope stress response membrane protein PspC [Sphingopyxis sp.]
MEPRRTKYYLDKQNAKLLGVCAGIADYTGVDTLWVRLGMVILTLSLGWPFFVYFIVAWMAQARPVGLYDSPEEARFWQGVRANPARSTRDVRASFRDLDRRLADVELFYTSRNTSLADEIESLR